MSTRQFQHYEDSVKEFNAAEEKMKNARKQFIDHVRATGVELRKAHVTDHRELLAAIRTNTDDYIGDNPGDVLALSMNVEISASKGYDIDPHKLDDIKNHLISQGWKILDSYGDTIGTGAYRGKHNLTCI